MNKKIQVLAAVALLWCCNGKDTLLDRYPMKPIVNPEIGVLLGGNGMIHVDFDGRQRIGGITETGTFVTSDRFRSFNFEPQPWQATDGRVAFGDGMIAHLQHAGGAFALRYSTDNGKTWTRYGEAIVDEGSVAFGEVAAVQLSVAADGSIWVLGTQDGEGDRRALLYQVDLEQQRSTLMMEKIGATPLAFGLAGSEHGWVLYSEGGHGADRVLVLRTENGGRSWVDGAALDRIGQPAVAPLTVDNLLVYDGEEDAAFLSTDGGRSFERVAVGGGIIACQAASPDVVYALLENGLAKSTDGGRTWTTQDAFVHGVGVSGSALDFHSARSGIVYGADRIFMTNNGGQSWDILVYPYDYVFD